VDLAGAARSESYRLAYEAVAGRGAMSRDEVFDGRAFVRDYLADRNVLFNVSAVVWRRQALLAALDGVGDELASWRVAGDWRLYVELLSRGGRIAYIAQALNLHCRDAASASARMPAQAHLDEIDRMHRLIRERIGPAPGLVGRQTRYLKEAAKHLRGEPDGGIA
jgi:hypothetical protein